MGYNVRAESAKSVRAELVEAQQKSIHGEPAEPSGSHPSAKLRVNGEAAKRSQKHCKTLKNLDFDSVLCYNTCNILPPPLCNVPTRECFL